MNNRLGRQTVTFDNPPIIIETASTVGQKEGKGPLKSTFDVILDDDTLGEKSWEKSESMLQKKTALLALEKAKLQQSDIDYILAGDLLNQCVGAHYSVRDFDIPFLGLYGACSTMTESMSIGSMIVSAGFADYAMCLTSSHFCSSEIQFRNPLEYGGCRVCDIVIKGNRSENNARHNGKSNRQRRNGYKQYGCGYGTGGD